MNTDKIKRSFDTERSVLGEILPLKTPFNVIIDVSERCNFQCRYCFRSDANKNIWGYAKDNQLMDWDTFVKTVEQVLGFEDEVRQISLSGHGEPLCNRKIPDMVRFMKAKGIRSRISIHTNASLLDREFIDDLIDSDIDRIVVSLQGMDSEKYWEVCRAKINFEAFYDNLVYLSQNKKHTQIHIKVMDVALGEGEKEKFYQRFLPIGDRVFVENEVSIWEGLKKENSVVKNKYGDCFPLQKVCPLIFHTLVVIPNGDVYPCTQLLQTEKLGNIKEKTLPELWNGEKRKEMLRDQCLLAAPKLCENCGIRQNTIYAKEDMIDSYRAEILDRLE